jgi:ParB/RepB/Spo0J family partition protein
METGIMTNATTGILRISDITVPAERMRKLRPEAVEKLAKSMQAQGRLLAPVIVRRSLPGTGYILVAGRHRVEAARKLGWDEIRAEIADDMTADAAALAEIDENLIRAELTPAERAAHYAARKPLYEKLHPETVSVTKRGGPGRGKKNARQNGDRFTKDTAKKTGKSERTVQREVERGDKIADVAELAGTSLDKPNELDALAKLPEDEQRKLAERAKSGEQVSAKRRDDVGPTSAGEMALKDVEIADLRNSKRRLEIENEGPRSQIDELRATTNKADRAAPSLDDADVELGALQRAWDHAREGVRWKFMQRVGLQLAPTPPPTDDDGLDIPTTCGGARHVRKSQPAR